MNKKVKIILASIIAFLIIVIAKDVYAASASLEAQNKSLKPGESTTITASVLETEVWNLKITANGGTLSGTTVNADSAGEEVSKNVISATFTASEEGNYTITLTGQVAGSDLVKKEITPQTVTINVKNPPPAPETGTGEEEPKQDEPKEETPVEVTPEFKDANKTMYASKNINLRASWSTSSKATSIGKGTELKVTATSNNKVNGYIWYRVSYNGATLYVASNLLTDTKPEEEKPTEQPTDEPKEETPVQEPTTVEEPNDEDEKSEVKDGLKSLEIEGITLSPAFSPDVYEYRAIVKKDLSELQINAVAASEGSTITIAGNENLQEGENLITIVVYNAEKQGGATYQITTNKSTLDLTDTDKMLQMGNKEAKRNATIFLVLLAVEVVVLIVIMILKKKNEGKEYEENFEEEKNQEHIEQNEEISTFEAHTEEDVVHEETFQEETQRTRREKRKGKHF